MATFAERAVLRRLAKLLAHDPRPIVACQRTQQGGVLLHTPTGDELLGRDGKHYEVAR